jgi:ABC-type transport system involved in multi-copper enzyme maturation permease subunit
LFVSAIVPVIMLFGAWALGDLEVNGEKLKESLQFSGPSAAGWALWARHFFLMPMLLLFAAGQCLAMERTNHNLRERLVRPVSRDTVLWSKALSLIGLSWLGLAITLVVALALATPIMGTDGPWKDVLLRYLASLFTDVAIVSYGLMLSVFFRSAAGVVVVGLVGLGIDFALRLAAKALGFLGVENAALIEPFMPGSGLNCWNVEESMFVWQHFAAAALWTFSAVLITRIRFRRMDVP